MSSKEKKKSLIIVLFLLIIVTVIAIYAFIKLEKTTYAYDEEQIKQNKNDNFEDVDNKFKVSEAAPVNLDSIIERNSKNLGYREEISVEEIELEYITKYRNNSTMYVGKTKVSQEGRNGIQAITTKKIYNEDGELLKEEQVSAVVVKSSLNKIIDIGTKKYEKNVLNGTTSGLDFNMALNRPSGFSLEQFTRALTDDKDKNKIFENNAKYFYYAEKQYNINGMFVAAVGIHESAWGTSKIAINKNNLFGYGAYDSNPYNGAYSFENYGESIDLVSRVFVKYYLNPKNTVIYDKNVANGRFYSGNTLTAVNKKYASDKQWANKVYKHMQYLYSKTK